MADRERNMEDARGARHKSGDLLECEQNYKNLSVHATRPFGGHLEVLAPGTSTKTCLKAQQMLPRGPKAPQYNCSSTFL